MIKDGLAGFVLQPVVALYLIWMKEWSANLLANAS